MLLCLARGHCEVLLGPYNGTPRLRAHLLAWTQGSSTPLCAQGPLGPVGPLGPKGPWDPLLKTKAILCVWATPNIDCSPALWGGGMQSW